MAKATICDKCGKIVKGRVACQIVTIPPLDFYNPYKTEPETIKRDLCKDCEKELMEWLRKNT